MVDTLTLRAPIDGRVQSSIITNVGQVVDSGQEVMRIVPQGSRLEIEAYVPNEDIGFVRVGQEAVIKVESFPFTRYGLLKARVMRIAKDAIPSPDASAIEGDPTRVSKASGFAGAERTQNLVFAVVLEPDASTIMVDGVARPLTSGMAATVEIKTGSRRLHRIPLLSGDGGRLESHARAVGVGGRPTSVRRPPAQLSARDPSALSRAEGVMHAGPHAPAARACCEASCVRIMSRSRTR